VPRSRRLSKIQRTILPEANSNVNCEMRIFGDCGDRLKKANFRSRRSPFFFPTALDSRKQWTGHCSKVPHQS
jgi:hypothetical protein